MKQILWILLENEPGSLSRVIGLFSQRGYNIESVTVSPTEDNTLSSMIIQTNGDTKTLEQIEKQLHKLINVLKITQIHPKFFIKREIALIKIQNSGYSTDQIMLIIKIYKAKIIDLTNKIYIIQITGKSKKINDCIKKISYISKILEISRSGTIGIMKTNSEI